jgi:plastocyanin
MRKSTILGAAMAAVAVIAMSTPAAMAEEAPVERTITIQAVQYDMHRHVDRTPFPAHTLEEYPDLEAGGGYALTPPNEKGEWRARAYVWAPSTVVVNEGERVTLEFYGIHSDAHPLAHIEGYDVDFEVKRGEITRVTFDADKAGIFRIVCPVHLPSMVGQLVVLPKTDATS